MYLYFEILTKKLDSMKGKLPVTGDILLESDEAQWSLLANGLINEFRMSGIVEIEPGRRVRVRMLIRQVLAPDQLRSENKCITQSNLGEEVAGGMNRINEHVANFLSSKQWIMIGEIESETAVPIIIVHYCLIAKSFYAQKTKDESMKKFLGNRASLN